MTATDPGARPARPHAGRPSDHRDLTGSPHGVHDDGQDDGQDGQALLIPGPGRVAFCRRCGDALRAERRGDRIRPVCVGCGAITFHNPAVGVAVVVRDEAGRVLLGRRSGSYGGQWCIPCGYVEWDEDVRLAATREFLEETGLIVELGEVVAVHSNFHNPDQHTVGIWFAGVVVGGVLAAADDLDTVGFFEPHLPPELAFPTDALVLAELSAALRGVHSDGRGHHHGGRSGN